MIIGLVIGGIILILIIVFLVAGVKIVSQTDVYVIERLGTFKRILKNGVNFKVPFIDKISLKETLKERVLDFPAQDVITKDNVTMKIDTVVYMQITDPKLFAYGVDRPLIAVENLTATTLRNLVGDLELDQTLTSRESVNEKLRSILDEATDAWGIKVLRVELKNILPPPDIQRAMEKQMRAEREKRELVLVAEGEKQSAILRAQGYKESAILVAEGTKKSIELVNASQPSAGALKLKSFDALIEVSKGQAMTILLPSDLAEVSTLAATFGTVAQKTSSKAKTERKTTKSLDALVGEIKKDKNKK